MDHQIRPAAEDDAADISALNAIAQAKHVAAVPWLFKDTSLDPAAIVSLMRGKNAVIYVADRNGRIAGYAYAEMRSYPETALTHPYLAMHLHQICVDQHFRRQGIACKLIEALRAAAKRNGAIRLTADVWDFNAEAKGLFQNCGMSPFLLRLWQSL